MTDFNLPSSFVPSIDLILPPNFQCFFLVQKEQYSIDPRFTENS